MKQRTVMNRDNRMNPWLQVSSYHVLTVPSLHESGCLYLDRRHVLNWTLWRADALPHSRSGPWCGMLNHGSRTQESRPNVTFQGPSTHAQNGETLPSDRMEPHPGRIVCHARVYLGYYQSKIVHRHTHACYAYGGCNVCSL